MSALNTHSKFYYGWRITTSNRYVDFNDGTGIKSITLKTGNYTSASLALELKKKMDAVSSLDFSVTFDRSTRKFTISTTSNFSLLFFSGPYSGQSIASILGFLSLDKVSASSYVSDFVSGYEYATQFFLQSYKDTSTNRKAIDGLLNESANGDVEVIKFGNKRLMEAEFLFITNIVQPTANIIRSNPQGVESFIQFIEWCTEKAPIEFMKDENKTSEFQSFVLESTPTDSKGLDYDLIETYDMKLPYYYKIGPLKFRLQE
jgi:hypothetical protein